MFDAVARRYDLTNTVLSLGRDRFWRRATRSALRSGPGDKVLDLAAGTAVSTVELAASGAGCVAADFSVGMLAAGAARDVPKVGADATRLPFADGVFDAVTISFGLRNVVDHVAGLREMARAYVGEQSLQAQADVLNFEKRLAQYRQLTARDPNYLNALWWDEMSRLYARLRENGRIDILDNYLGPDGLDITLFPPLPRKK